MYIYIVKFLLLLMCKKKLLFWLFWKTQLGWVLSVSEFISAYFKLWAIPWPECVAIWDHTEQELEGLDMLPEDKPHNYGFAMPI